MRKNIYGVIASKGIGKGNVRICNSMQDIKHVKDGDVLVLAMFFILRIEIEQI